MPPKGVPGNSRKATKPLSQSRKRSFKQRDAMDLDSQSDADMDVDDNKPNATALLAQMRQVDEALDSALKFEVSCDAWYDQVRIGFGYAPINEETDYVWQRARNLEGARKHMMLDSIRKRYVFNPENVIKVQVHPDWIEFIDEKGRKVEAQKTLPKGQVKYNDVPRAQLSKSGVEAKDLQQLELLALEGFARKGAVDLLLDEKKRELRQHEEVLAKLENKDDIEATNKLIEILKDQLETKKYWVFDYFSIAALKELVPDRQVRTRVLQHWARNRTTAVTGESEGELMAIFGWRLVEAWKQDHDIYLHDQTLKNIPRKHQDAAIQQIKIDAKIQKDGTRWSHLMSEDAVTDFVRIVAHLPTHLTAEGWPKGHAMSSGFLSGTFLKKVSKSPWGEGMVTIVRQMFETLCLIVSEDGIKARDLGTIVDSCEKDQKFYDDMFGTFRANQPSDPGVLNGMLEFAERAFNKRLVPFLERDVSLRDSAAAREAWKLYVDEVSELISTELKKVGKPSLAYWANIRARVLLQWHPSRGIPPLPLLSKGSIRMVIDALTKNEELIKEVTLWISPVHYWKNLSKTVHDTSRSLTGLIRLGLKLDPMIVDSDAAFNHLLAFFMTSAGSLEAQLASAALVNLQKREYRSYPEIFSTFFDGFDKPNLDGVALHPDRKNGKKSYGGGNRTDEHPFYTVFKTDMDLRLEIQDIIDQLHTQEFWRKRSKYRVSVDPILRRLAGSALITQGSAQPFRDYNKTCYFAAFDVFSAAQCRKDYLSQEGYWLREQVHKILSEHCRAPSELSSTAAVSDDVGYYFLDGFGVLDRKPTTDNQSSTKGKRREETMIPTGPSKRQKTEHDSHSDESDEDMFDATSEKPVKAEEDEITLAKANLQGRFKKEHEKIDAELKRLVGLGFPSLWDPVTGQSDGALWEMIFKVGERLAENAYGAFARKEGVLTEEDKKPRIPDFTQTRRLYDKKIKQGCDSPTEKNND